jgi:adenosylcobinamide-phosphate synthase
MLDLTIAVLLDWLIGDPFWFPHPIIFIGRFIGYLEKKARKQAKNNRSLRLLGLLIVVVVAGVSFIIPYAILKIASVNTVIVHIVNIIILWTTIASKSLHTEAAKVYISLKNNDLKDARIKLSYIVGRDTKDLSENEVIRADVETVAENTADGVIAPLFYAAIGGAPLAMLYKAINTMDSMLGYKNEKFFYIGFFPAKIDDIFNFIPARITGLLISLSAPVVGGNIIESIKIMIRDRKNHKSPNCAYPEGAAAGAMKVQLGGINTYFGEKVYKPTIGDYIKPLEADNIFQTIKLMYFAEVLFMIILFIGNVIVA